MFFQPFYLLSFDLAFTKFSGSLPPPSPLQMISRFQFVGGSETLNISAQAADLVFNEMQKRIPEKGTHVDVAKNMSSFFTKLTKFSPRVEDIHLNNNFLGDTMFLVVKMTPASPSNLTIVSRRSH